MKLAMLAPCLTLGTFVLRHFCTHQAVTKIYPQLFFLNVFPYYSLFIPKLFFYSSSNFCCITLHYFSDKDVITCLIYQT